MLPREKEKKETKNRASLWLDMLGRRKRKNISQGASRETERTQQVV